MQKQGKLELTWVGKYDEHKIEPRILVEDKSKSYGDPNSENMLIHGDNLIALQALQQDFSGRIKCIYCDPPYNINAANEHYDDYIENSMWLSLMAKRLELLSTLLADDGVILVQIDKEQSAYLKVLMDEVFSRESYITTIAVRMSATSGFKIEHSDKTIVKNTEYIHVYSKNLKIHPAYEEVGYDSHYSNIIKPDNDGIYKLCNLIDEEQVKNELKKYSLKPSTSSLQTLFEISDTFRTYVYENRDFIGRTHNMTRNAKYVMMHTFAHLIIKEMSLYSGYSSSSIKERIYCSDKMSGVLLYTGSSDKEGSLGGLVELGEFQHIIKIMSAAFANALICTNDPECGSHVPNIETLNGAACHSCTMISETSCENGNRMLDRSLVVPLDGRENLSFFRELVKELCQLEI